MTSGRRVGNVIPLFGQKLSNKEKKNTPWPSTATDKSISTQQPTKNKSPQQWGVWRGGATGGRCGRTVIPQMRILRFWQERWELEKVGPNGESIFEVRLTKYYKGLIFFDIGENNRVMTAHKMIFQKKRGNNA